jgi:hypothetical protein
LLDLVRTSRANLRTAPPGARAPSIIQVHTRHNALLLRTSVRTSVERDPSSHLGLAPRRSSFADSFAFGSSALVSSCGSNFRSNCAVAGDSLDVTIAPPRPAVSTFRTSTGGPSDVRGARRAHHQRGGGHARHDRAGTSLTAASSVVVGPGRAGRRNAVAPLFLAASATRVSRTAIRLSLCFAIDVATGFVGRTGREAARTDNMMTTPVAGRAPPSALPVKGRVGAHSRAHSFHRCRRSGSAAIGTNGY